MTFASDNSRFCHHVILLVTICCFSIFWEFWVKQSRDECLASVLGELPETLEQLNTITCEWGLLCAGARDQALHYECGCSQSDHAHAGEGIEQRQVRISQSFKMVSFFIQHLLGCCKFFTIFWGSANGGFYSSWWFLSFSGEEWKHVVGNSTLFLMSLIKYSIFIKCFLVLTGTWW